MPATVEDPICILKSGVPVSTIPVIHGKALVVPILARLSGNTIRLGATNSIAMWTAFPSWSDVSIFGTDSGQPFSDGFENNLVRPPGLMGSHSAHSDN